MNVLDGAGSSSFYIHKNYCEECKSSCYLPRKVIWFFKKNLNRIQLEYYIDLCDDCYEQLEDNVLR